MFNTEDLHEQAKVDQVFATSEDHSVFGAAEYYGPLTFQVSASTAFEGQVTIFRSSLLFSAETASFILSLPWKQLDPFQLADPNGEVVKLGFTLHGASDNYEFLVNHQDDLEQILDVLYPKMIILGV
jgi:hypothetical protein